MLSVSRLPQPLNEAPGAVTIIDAELIRRSGARDFLKYATDTGELYYDADGSGAGALQLIATVRSGGITPAIFQFHPTTDIVIVD